MIFRIVSFYTYHIPCSPVKCKSFVWHDLPTRKKQSQESHRRKDRESGSDHVKVAGDMPHFIFIAEKMKEKMGGRSGTYT